MTTIFHKLVKKHKPKSFTQERIVFKTFQSANAFVLEFQKNGYQKQIEIHLIGKYWNVVRGKKKTI